MKHLTDCQIPSLVNIAEGKVEMEPLSFIQGIKRMFAKPWNQVVKKGLKKGYAWSVRLQEKIDPEKLNLMKRSREPVLHLKAGDRVRVRSIEEIRATLNPFKELKGCAFIADMEMFCNTEQTVLKPLERFIDERDYQVKKAKRVVLLENVFCNGTPVFGRCDRSCFLFWREEWLEKI